MVLPECFGFGLMINRLQSLVLEYTSHLMVHQVSAVFGSGIQCLQSLVLVHPTHLMMHRCLQSLAIELTSDGDSGIATVL